MAFNSKEVMSLRERDFRYGRIDNPTPCCQFPHTDQDAGGIDCRGDVQVHHILPQMFGAVWVKAVKEQIDNELNAIAICENSHVRSNKGVHTDQAEAYKQYGSDRTVFERLQGERREKAERGEPYWNPQFDARLAQQALKNTWEGKRRGWQMGRPSRSFTTVWERIRTPRSQRPQQKSSHM